jgi:enoyl-CoA hydratase/carnithine racemase
MEGRIARLVLDRPDKRNAINQAMWDAIPDLVGRASAAARLLLLEGVPGGVFSAGADIAEFASGSLDREWRAANQAAIRAAMSSVASAPVPTIALIEGDCVGGGCGLALCCDLRLAGPAARLGITPARLGLVYSLEDTRRLVEAVGPAQAKRILFTGALFGAQEAARIGLVTLLADDVRAAADELARAVLASSGHSQRETKAMIARVLAGQREDDEATLRTFAQAFDGADFREGSAAFLERRPAVFE